MYLNQQNEEIDKLKNALWLAIMQNKNDQIVQFFKSPRIELNVNTPLTIMGLTALHQACSNGNLSLVQFLVAIQKANIDQQDYQGRTSLHYACAIGNQAIVEYLIQSKACVNIQAMGGDTAVMKAAQFHQSHLLLYLLETHFDKIEWNLCNRIGQNVFTIYKSLSVQSANQLILPNQQTYDVGVELMKLLK